MFKKFDIEAEYFLFILSLIIIIGLIGYYSYTRTDAYQNAHSEKTETQNNLNNSAVSSKSGNMNSFNFSGSKTQVITLKEGLNEFNVEYNGNSTFHAAILYSDGVLLDSLANSRGSYKGITGVVPPESRNYILSVQCGDNGQWSISRRN